MKYVIIILIASCLYGCSNGEEYKFKKPFVIISKGVGEGNELRYFYQDSNGVKNSFSDIKNYNIGDTIK